MAQTNKIKEPFDYLVEREKGDQDNIFKPGEGLSQGGVRPDSVGRTQSLDSSPLSPAPPAIENPVGGQKGIWSPQVQTSPKPQTGQEGQTNMPTTYINPLTGEDTGMSWDMFYEDWQSQYGNVFQGYGAYLDYMLNVSGQNTGFNPIWTDPFGTGSANQNAPWGGEGTAPGQGYGNMEWNYGGATQGDWAPGEEGGLKRRGHGNPPELDE